MQDLMAILMAVVAGVITQIAIWLLKGAAEILKDRKEKKNGRQSQDKNLGSEDPNTMMQNSMERETPPKQSSSCRKSI